MFVGDLGHVAEGDPSLSNGFGPLEVSQRLQFRLWVVGHRCRSPVHSIEDGLATDRDDRLDRPRRARGHVLGPLILDLQFVLDGLFVEFAFGLLDLPLGEALGVGSDLPKRLGTLLRETLANVLRRGFG